MKTIFHPRMKNDQKNEILNHILLRGVVPAIPGLIVMVIIFDININDMVFIPLIYRYASNNANGCNSKVVTIANAFTNGPNNWRYH